MVALPGADELELSVFGAGIGESLVLHVGAGSWVVVDSCMNAATDRPVALDYLESLRVDVSRQVKLVVVTHWHDDHMQGAAQLLREASQAEFACSAALWSREFFTLVAASEQVKLVQHFSGLDEFREILEILEARSASRRPAGPHCWAQEGTTILRDGASGTEVHALSPSSQTITNAIGNFAKLIPNIGPIRRFVTDGPNQLSVALLVKSEGVNLLLGGDLQTVADSTIGWRAVLASTRWPRVLSCAFKIPHHGSKNAHCDEVWRDCLVTDPWAFVTPYSRGNSAPPTSADISRIKGLTGRAFLAIDPSKDRPQKRRGGGVENTLRQVAKTRRAMARTPGHIRLRIPIHGSSADGSVELSDGAIAI